MSKSDWRLSHFRKSWPHQLEAPILEALCRENDPTHIVLQGSNESRDSTTGAASLESERGEKDLEGAFTLS